MKVPVLSTTGSVDGDIELPLVFSTPVRNDLIHRAYIHLESHSFQRQGRYPNAGMDVVAESNSPPTGHHQARVARMAGGGGGRQGQAGGVAMVRKGRQAHPPTSERVIYKMLNKKENKLALCSALAATTSSTLVKLRGHKIDKITTLPLVVSDQIESVSKSKELAKILDSLNLTQDVDRLRNRLKGRSGKPLLRGRKTKVGKSILLVVKDSKNLAKASGSLLGVDVVDAKNLSVLDLAPGAQPVRLTVFSKGAIEEISKIKSPHLEILVTTK
ncbi:50S ribosomal protein L4 [Nitrosotalea sinensis]|jgi:large subunit ribosomal protein L4e|uniref:50S ribosomal protein L4 n=1 Tax=Nitrosotalea sinensis TaxID=1499975 RepID=A0A2H1EIE0_9ARCH|nr:50S ribosomal protein L4 [Candidatus Nitrosotalea sinensis]SHO46898.1 50S ribosomal protein L4 [Candidatus Nitrosotalea sinensis]